MLFIKNGLVQTMAGIIIIYLSKGLTNSVKPFSFAGRCVH